MLLVRFAWINVFYPIFHSIIPNVFYLKNNNAMLLPKFQNEPLALFDEALICLLNVLN